MKRKIIPTQDKIPSYRHYLVSIQTNQIKSNTRSRPSDQPCHVGQAPAGLKKRPTTHTHPIHWTAGPNYRRQIRYVIIVAT